MSRWVDAVIERIETRTPRSRSLFLRSTLAPHIAGQHVDLRLTAEDGYAARRSYSVASAPDDVNRTGTTRIELLIERLDDGEVSGFLHEVAQVGDTIELQGPLGGHFIWRPEDGAPVLWIAGGSGIAPLAAMARQRARAAPNLPALLMHSARTWDDLAFRHELIAMAHADFVFIATTTREPARRPQDFDRRIDAEMLHEALARWGRVPRQVYVCGSTPFVEAVNAALLSCGVPAAAIRAERYGKAT